MEGYGINEHMIAGRKIPWFRLAAEGVVIISSILIAFMVDAWWEERLERQDEQSYLASLHQEFVHSRALIIDAEKGRSVVLDANELLVAQAQGAARVPSELLLYWFSLLSMPLDLSPPRAVFDDLVSSGGTLLIRSDNLRIALAQYSALLARAGKTTDEAWAVWTQRIQPFLEGRIPRIDRLRHGMFGKLAEEDGLTLPFDASPHGADFDGVLSNPAFEDMLAERWLRVENSKDDAAKLRAHVEEIIRLIEIELGQSGGLTGL